MPTTSAVNNRNFAWTAISIDPQFQAVVIASADDRAKQVLTTLIKRQSIAWDTYVSSWNRILATTTASTLPKPSKYSAWNENLKAYKIPMRFNDDGTLSLLDPQNPPAD